MKVVVTSSKRTREPKRIVTFSTAIITLQFYRRSGQARKAIENKGRAAKTERMSDGFPRSKERPRNQRSLRHMAQQCCAPRKCRRRRACLVHLPNAQ